MPRKQLSKKVRRQQVKTTIKNNGEDFYKLIGSIGGYNSPNKFTPEKGKAAANKRWEKYREQQNNEEKGEQ